MISGPGSPWRSLAAPGSSWLLGSPIRKASRTFGPELHRPSDFDDFWSWSLQGTSRLLLVAPGAWDVQFERPPEPSAQSFTDLLILMISAPGSSWDLLAAPGSWDLQFQRRPEPSAQSFTDPVILTISAPGNSRDLLAAPGCAKSCT